MGTLKPKKSAFFSCFSWGWDSSAFAFCITLKTVGLNPRWFCKPQSPAWKQFNGIRLLLWEIAALKSVQKSLRNTILHLRLYAHSHQCNTCYSKRNKNWPSAATISSHKRMAENVPVHFPVNEVSDLSKPLDISYGYQRFTSKGFGARWNSGKSLVWTVKLMSRASNYAGQGKWFGGLRESGNWPILKCISLEKLVWTGLTPSVFLPLILFSLPQPQEHRSQKSQRTFLIESNDHESFLYIKWNTLACLPRDKVIKPTREGPRNFCCPCKPWN